MILEYRTMFSSFTLRNGIHVWDSHTQLIPSVMIMTIWGQTLLHRRRNNLCPSPFLWKSLSVNSRPTRACRIDSRTSTQDTAALSHYYDYSSSLFQSPMSVLLPGTDGPPLERWKVAHRNSRMGGLVWKKVMGHNAPASGSKNLDIVPMVSCHAYSEGKFLLQNTRESVQERPLPRVPITDYKIQLHRFGNSMVLR